MFKLLGNKKLLMLMLALVVFIALMGFTLGKRQLTWPEMIIKDTVSWTQGIFYKPARYIAGFFEDIRDLKQTYEENKVLRMTLSQYAKDTMRLNLLESQNKELKDILGFTQRQKDANHYKFRPAEVVSVNPDPYSNSVNINLGSQDGIKENMAVMTVDGLIGRISRVSNFYSSVQLLVDMNQGDGNSSPERQLEKGVAATVKGKESAVFGTIEYYDPKQQVLVMTRVSTNSEDNLEVGDTVVTSGLGQVFPPGIEIGKVVDKKIGEFGITYNAMIQPKAKDFRHLREVLVVEVPGVE